MKKFAILILINLILLGCHQSLPPELRNSKPNLPKLLFPANDTTRISVNLTFKWKGSDPNKDDTLTYDFFLAANNPDPSLFITNLTADSLTVTSLEYETQYYWKVTAFDQNGASNQSPIFAFQTRHPNNVAPYAPSAPQPTNLIAGVSINDVQLSWQGGDPNLFSVVTYNLFFGRNESLLKPLAEKLTDNFYSLPLLLFNTRYFWKVQAEDDYGLQTDGPVWHFRTLIADSLFKEDFEAYLTNQNPSGLIWTVYEDQADLFVTDETSFDNLGKSVCFTDSTLAGNSFLAAILPEREIGQVQFYWKVSSATDFFGMRLYSSVADTAHLGPQLSIRSGELQYFDKSQLWHTVSQIQAERWYLIQVVFDCSAQYYNIYVDGELKIQNAGWLGTIVPQINRVYFLTFDNRSCQKAFVDEIKFYAQ